MPSGDVCDFAVIAVLGDGAWIVATSLFKTGGRLRQQGGQSKRADHSLVAEIHSVALQLVGAKHDADNYARVVDKLRNHQRKILRQKPFAPSSQGVSFDGWITASSRSAFLRRC